MQWLQAAQGEVKHDFATGVAMGSTCKSVELGVLFHSSAKLAYYADPPVDRACSLCCSCHCRVEVPRSSSPGPGPRRSVSVDALPLPCSLATVAPVPAAVGEATPTTESGEGRRRRRRRRRYAFPQAVPLPVPFCLNSEDYADRERGSPHVRFPPYMHDLGGSPR